MKIRLHSIKFTCILHFDFSQFSKYYSTYELSIGIFLSVHEPRPKTRPSTWRMGSMR